MLALVKTEQGPGHVKLMDVAEPEPGPGEIKIQVAATGVCGTDLHILHGQAFAVVPPVIMGHEFAGTVAAVGAGVTAWAVGDRVTAEPPARTCGMCEYCQTGLPALCADRRSLGSGVNGAFAACVVAPAHRVHRVPEGVDFLSGALAEPTACCVHAVVEQGHVSAGDVVLVAGPGPIGLLTAQVARAQGAAVLLVGTAEDEERLSIGRELGIDVVLAAGREEVLGAVARLTAGRGADAVFECAGAGAAVRTCLEAARKRGHYVQVGLLARPIEMDFGQVVTKEVKVTGSFGSTYTSWERALELMASGKVRARPLITADLPLTQWEEGFGQMERKRGCKVVLRPDGA